MSTIDQALALIQQMDRREKAQLLAAVARDPDVQYPHIAVTPGVCGGAPRVAGTRVPVWVLSALRRDGASDQDIIDAYPRLNPGLLKAAWSFADQNPQLIADEIAANEAA